MPFTWWKKKTTTASVDSRHQSEHKKITIHLWIVQIIDFLLNFFLHRLFTTDFISIWYVFFFFLYIFLSFGFVFVYIYILLSHGLVHLAACVCSSFGILRLVGLQFVNSEHEITNREEKRCYEYELSNFHFFFRRHHLIVAVFLFGF